MPGGKQPSGQPDWNIGYTTRQHLCLDLDDTTFFHASRLVQMVMQQYPEVGNALLLCSSRPKYAEKWVYPPGKNMYIKRRRHNFHAVFNNFIGYEACCQIIANLAHLGVLNEQYIKIREMRNDMTIRTSSTANVDGVKPKPYIVDFVYNYRSRENGNGIRLFMALLKASR